MRIFIRVFNDSINSKTGIPLPPDAPRRGTPEWKQFEEILFSVIKDLGYPYYTQKEHPSVPDNIVHENILKKIYVHNCLRNVPHGDLFYMQMHMRYLFTMDTCGWGCEHSGYRKFDPLCGLEGTAFCQELSDSLLASGLSKHLQPEVTDMTPERFILIPTQTPRDYTIRWHSPVTVKYFVESCVAWANETQNHICIKLHPFGKDADIVSAVEPSRYVHKVEGNIHELIKRSKGVFVINSGTGFEALVHGKPVVTFGNCDYNLVTHNGDIRRLDEARNFIYSYPDEYRRLAYSYVEWYHKVHAYDVRFPQEAKERLTAYMKETLK